MPGLSFVSTAVTPWAVVLTTPIARLPPPLRYILSLHSGSLAAAPHDTRATGPTFSAGE